MEVVGINDLTGTKTLAHLLKYDSTQGRFNGEVSHNESSLIVNGVEIPVTAERSPLAIKWQQTPDVVVEATGIFRSRESNKGGYGDHLKNGAKKVILTVPAKDAIDNMIVLGANDNELRDEDECVSNASCTTNCLAPVAKILNDNWGLKRGLHPPAGQGFIQLAAHRGQSNRIHKSIVARGEVAMITHILLKPHRL
jgi:glyceraldehyde 3-phosphate dehydrogenase